MAVAAGAAAAVDAGAGAAADDIKSPRCRVDIFSSGSCQQAVQTAGRGRSVPARCGTLTLG